MLDILLKYVLQSWFYEFEHFLLKEPQAGISKGQNSLLTLCPNPGDHLTS